MKKKLTRRKAPEARKTEIIEAAVRLAEKHGYKKVSRNMIGDELGVAGTVVQYHFGTMGQVLKAIKRAAVNTENLVIIAQMLAEKDDYLKHVSMELRYKAAGSLVS